MFTLGLLKLFDQLLENLKPINVPFELGRVERLNF